MKSYTEVKSQDDMEKLLNSIAGFHDSMAKDIHIANSGWVNEDHIMAMSHQFDVQLLVQSQWQPYAIELVFCNVRDTILSETNFIKNGIPYLAPGRSKTHAVGNLKLNRDIWKSDNYTVKFSVKFENMKSKKTQCQNDCRRFTMYWSSRF